MKVDFAPSGGARPQPNAVFATSRLPFAPSCPLISPRTQFDEFTPLFSLISGGTLVDSAPDLAGAVNDLQVEGRPPGTAVCSVAALLRHLWRAALLKAGLDRHLIIRTATQRKRFLAIYDRRSSIAATCLTACWSC